MLNTKEFISRLQEIMDKKQLKAAAFSALIGVQRSSVSHILSQRNKPSLEFVLKIHDTFDDIDLTWLLLGENSSSIEQAPQTPSIFDSPSFDKKQTEIEDSIKETIVSPKDEAQEIEAIITLFKDGRFKKYSPKS